MSDHHPPTSHHHRQRSRSPAMQSQHDRRERSPHHRHHRRRPKEDVREEPKLLPYNSRHLTKKDYPVFRPMFALYLDIQKSKILEELEEVEVKGRWKSFIRKWNCGELSEGWYDPSTFKKAIESNHEPVFASRERKPHSVSPTTAPQNGRVARSESEESDESVGPVLPGQETRSRRGKAGPSIPSMDDLELKREMDQEDDISRREDIRMARKVDRKQQKEALDELVPRAEGGTRERQLEKKKELNEKLKSFREKSPGAEEVPESELMGGGDGLADFKKQKNEFERKKNDRELRKEEMLRARMAEREERLSDYREKEDKTMQMLRTLAKQNFG